MHSPECHLPKPHLFSSQRPGKEPLVLSFPKDLGSSGLGQLSLCSFPSGFTLIPLSLAEVASPAEGKSHRYQASRKERKEQVHAPARKLFFSDASDSAPHFCEAGGAGEGSSFLGEAIVGGPGLLLC